MSRSEVLNIFEYLDYRVFMRAFYNQEKAKNPRFSYSVWNERAGFKSRSYLRLVMLGQRDLTAESLPRVTQALGLNKRQSHFFELLTHFNQASSLESREFYLKQILKLSKAHTTEAVSDTYRFLSSHVTPRILSYLIMKDLESTAVKISQSLSLPLDLINQNLESLEALGLVQKDQDSREWTARVKQVEVPSEFGNLALQSFHSKLLQETITALQINPQQRHFLSTTLTLSEEQYAECVQECSSLLDLLLARFQTQKGHNKKIFHFNLQLIPVSERLIQRTSLCAQESPPTDDKHKEVIL